MMTDDESMGELQTKFCREIQTIRFRSKYDHIKPTGRLPVYPIHGPRQCTLLESLLREWDVGMVIPFGTIWTEHFLKLVSTLIYNVKINDYPLLSYASELASQLVCTRELLAVARRSA